MILIGQGDFLTQYWVLPSYLMQNSADRLLMMTAKLREMVSKNKRRFREDGFDLDLSYIEDNIIAMGFPAKKLEGVYRNHIDDVVRFLETRHKNHYKIYNLCRERERGYDPQRFCNRVASYPFDDHNPPSLDALLPFCQDMDKWLNDHPSNIAAVHCKAGKGRTGVMICAYLLYIKKYSSAEEAMRFYGSKRTLDTNGVTIPSQRRYVEYFQSLMTNGYIYHVVPMLLRSIELEGVPSFDITGTCTPYFVVYVDGHKVYKSSAVEVKRNQKSISINVSDSVVISGDVRIAFFHKPRKLQKRERMFQFWFNTFFICPGLQQAQLNRDAFVPNGPVDNSNSTGNSREALPPSHSNGSSSSVKWDCRQRQRQSLPTLGSPLVRVGQTTSVPMVPSDSLDSNILERSATHRAASPAITAPLSQSFPHFVSASTSSTNHSPLLYSSNNQSRRQSTALSADPSLSVLPNGSLEAKLLSNGSVTADHAARSTTEEMQTENWAQQLQNCHVLSLSKAELDRAYKDKNSKNFDPNFKINMYMKCMDTPVDSGVSGGIPVHECPLKYVRYSVTSGPRLEEKSPIARCVPSSASVAAVIASCGGGGSNNSPRLQPDRINNASSGRVATVGSSGSASSDTGEKASSSVSSDDTEESEESEDEDDDYECYDDGGGGCGADDICCHELESGSNCEGPSTKQHQQLCSSTTGQHCCDSCCHSGTASESGGEIKAEGTGTVSSAAGTKVSRHQQRNSTASPVPSGGGQSEGATVRPHHHHHHHGSRPHNLQHQHSHSSTSTAESGHSHYSHCRSPLACKRTQQQEAKSKVTVRLSCDDAGNQPPNPFSSSSDSGGDAAPVAEKSQEAPPLCGDPPAAEQVIELLPVGALDQIASLSAESSISALRRGSCPR